MPTKMETMSNIIASNSQMSGQLSQFDGKKIDWVTDNDTPDPDVLPEITGWNILIRPVNPGDSLKMASGVKFFLPDSFTEDVKYLTNVGQVKAMGPSCYTDPNVKPADGKYFPHGRYGSKWCDVGDYVVWGKHQGTKILVKGVAFVLLTDELVLMKIKDPADINPMFNAFKV